MSALDTVDLVLKPETLPPDPICPPSSGHTVWIQRVQAAEGTLIHSGLV